MWVFWILCVKSVPNFKNNNNTMDLYGIYKQTALPFFYVFIIALQFPVLNR